jgi:hypothetical protein
MIKTLKVACENLEGLLFARQRSWSRSWCVADSSIDAVTGLLHETDNGKPSTDSEQITLHTTGRAGRMSTATISIR